MSTTLETDAVIANPLRASGLIDAAGLEKGRAYQREHGGLLSDALLRLNLIREQDFLKVFAELYSTRFVKAEKLRTLKLDDALLERVGVRSAERLRMCPIRWDTENSELHVVAAVPLAANLELELKQIVGSRTVSVYVATAGAVAALIRRSFYREEGAFSQVTNNGAGPQLLPRRTIDINGDPESDEEGSHRETTTVAPMNAATATQVAHVPTQQDGSGENPEHHPVRERSSDGKTVMINVDELTIATLRKENTRYRIAQEFHKRVTLERSLEAMVDRILSVIFELMSADGAAIWLNTGQFASKSRDGSKRIDVSRTIIDQALVAEGGVLTHNALIDERFDRSKSVMTRGVRSVMAVPIRTRNGTMGILYVESTSQSAAFGDDDLSVLDSIAAQAAILLDNASLVARVKQEMENRVSLSRFLSPAAVEEVLSGRMALKMEGSAAEVTVLFADIRGFTSMSSTMPPEEVVRFLNSFFTEAVDAIERHHGVVDKFIGDCVMAMWGAPIPREDDARNALMAALELIERGSHITVNGYPLEMGVGINTGLAVVGAIGSRKRLDYTSIGSTVNLAARLCGIARGGEVLLSSDTLMRAGPGVVTEASEPVILKGLDTPMVPYVLRSLSQPMQLSQPIPLQQVAHHSPYPAAGGRGRK